MENTGFSDESRISANCLLKTYVSLTFDEVALE